MYFYPMSSTTIPRHSLSQFSAFSANFSVDQTPFSEFITSPFQQLSDLTKQIEKKKKSYSDSHRKTLVETLRTQLKSLSSLQESNLELLANETTFTITTGHQLTLFGGPLFMIYKVLHVVRLCQQYNASQDNHATVPIFWMASEDHDFEEIQSSHLFSKELKWETSQVGAVGRFNLVDFQNVLQEFQDLFTDNPEAEIHSLLNELPNDDYNEHFQTFISRLFQQFGVLVIQPDDATLKSLFSPVIKRELTEKCAIKAVELTDKKLLQIGLQPQAKARACNLFYLNETGRHRIDPIESGFVVDGETFSSEEMMELVDKSPERFSPNVILRPVYQETILPNLAYVGGGGEMAYWIQLKGVFEAHQTQFPLLQQRVSMHLIDGGTAKRMAKIGWETQRFFQPKETLRKEYLAEFGEEKMNMEPLETAFQTLRLKMIEQAKNTDIGLESFAEAETVRLGKQLESFQQRLVKTVKQQHEQGLKTLDSISDRFLPNNELQERYFHWLNFAPTGNYTALFDALFENINPFQPDLIVVELGN